MDLRFVPGSTHLVVGPSSSGKTFRVTDILRLKNSIFQKGESVQNIVFYYATWQPVYSKLKQDGVVSKFVNKCPSNGDFIQDVKDFQHHGGSIVVIDDFMSSINKDLVEIVTVTSRHMNTSTFILFQSLFPANPLARQISLNAKYLHIHKNPRENAQIQYLARQLRPDDYKWIVDAYHDATTKPYSCFLIDLLQNREEHLRFRSNYLPREFPMIVYMSKKMRV
jgi:hypothetical protein